MLGKAYAHQFRQQGKLSRAQNRAHDVQNGIVVGEFLKLAFSSFVCFVGDVGGISFILVYSCHALSNLSRIRSPQLPAYQCLG